MPRVLHILGSLDIGGAETNLLNFAAASRNNSEDVHVAYCGDGALQGSFLENNITLFRVAEERAKVASAMSLVIIKRLSEYALKEKIEILHSHVFTAHIWAVGVSYLTGIPLVEHVHDSRYQNHEEFNLRGERNQQFKHVNLLRRQANRTVVLTDLNRNNAIARKINSPRNIIKIYNGIPLHSRRPNLGSPLARETLNVPSDAFLVVTPIRMTAEKNCCRLFSIIRHVCRRNKNICFVVAGDGQLRQTLMRMVRDAELSHRVKLPGFVTDMTGLYLTADALLLPSLLELNSMAILEALSWRLPVVTSADVGFNSEVFRHGLNAFLHNPFVDDGWVETLDELERNPDLVQRVGRAGYQLCAQQFDISRCVAEFQALYSQMLADIDGSRRWRLSTLLK